MSSVCPNFLFFSDLFTNPIGFIDGKNTVMDCDTFEKYSPGILVLGSCENVYLKTSEFHIGRSKDIYIYDNVEEDILEFIICAFEESYVKFCTMQNRWRLFYPRYIFTVANISRHEEFVYLQTNPIVDTDFGYFDLDFEKESYEIVLNKDTTEFKSIGKECSITFSAI